MHDKRLVTRLESYWNGLRGDLPYPPKSKINPNTIIDMWGKCLLLGVEQHPAKKTALYVYEHMGEEVAEAYGSDLTGQYVNVHMHNFPGWQVLKSVDQMLEEPIVRFNEGSFVNAQDCMVKYRACILPLGHNERITHVLAGLSWKTLS